MTDKTVQPGSSGMLRMGMIAAALAAAVALWMQRPAGDGAGDARLAAYAAQCPRWVSLAEDLLPVEGRLHERCEYVTGPSSMFSPGDHVFKAASNIEVRVTLASDAAAVVPASVVIRDTKSQASVTYNAEALALLK
jgi:hypothetical protein